MIYISVLMSVRPGGGDESLHQQPLSPVPAATGLRFLPVMFRTWTWCCSRSVGLGLDVGGLNKFCPRCWLCRSKSLKLLEPLSPHWEMGICMNYWSQGLSTTSGTKQMLVQRYLSYKGNWLHPLWAHQTQKLRLQGPLKLRWKCPRALLRCFTATQIFMLYAF